MSKQRISKRILLWCLLLIVIVSAILLVIYFSNMHDDYDCYCYYISDGSVYKTDGNGTELLTDEEDLEVKSVQWKDNILCMAACRTSDIDGVTMYSKPELFVYNEVNGTWDCLIDSGIYFANAIVIDGEFIYYMCDSDGTIARINVNNSSVEVFDIQHLFTYRSFSVTEGLICTLNLSSDGDSISLYQYSLADGTLTEIALNLTSEEVAFVSDRCLYKVTYSPSGLGLDTSIVISKAEVPMQGKDNIRWTNLSILTDTTVGEYGYWSYSYVEFYGEYVFYETPDGDLWMYHDGTHRFLWEIPENHDSAIFEPTYFMGEKLFAVVYHEFKSPIVYTEES